MNHAAENILISEQHLRSCLRQYIELRDRHFKNINFILASILWYNLCFLFALFFSCKSNVVIFMDWSQKTDSNSDAVVY